MVKYIYKVVVLMVLFCGALFFFGSRLQNDSYETGKVIEAGNETFPYLTIKSQGVEMNRLYGYSGVLDANIVRESITPLGQDKSINVLLGGADTKIVKMEYEVVDKDTLEVYEKKKSMRYPKRRERWISRSITDLRQVRSMCFPLQRRQSPDVRFIILQD